MRLEGCARAFGAVVLTCAAVAHAEGETAPVEQVIVRGGGSGGRTPPKDRSVAGSVIGADQLRGPGVQAADVLRNQTGVTVAETGGIGELATASIRGATSAQTPVYVGGVRVNDDVGGTADLSLVPLWLIDRVEIYRGNAPIEGDRLGIGGAVFFEPRRPRRSELAAGAMAGSFGARSTWVRGGIGGERAGALLGLRYEAADNDYTFRDDRGTRFDNADDAVRRRRNADVRTYDAWIIARAPLGPRASADLLVNEVQREQGIPGLSLVPTLAARGTLSRALVAPSVTLPCSRLDRCEIQASTAVLVSHATYDDPLSEIGTGAARTEVRGERLDESLRARLRLSDALTVRPALTVSSERLSVDEDGRAAQRARKVASRAAVGARVEIAPQLVAHGLLSGECHGAYRAGSGAICAQFAPSARVGLEVGGPEQTLLLNAGRYARVPTLGELFGVSGAVRGNAELVPESGITWEIGLRARRRAWGPLANVYVDAFGYGRHVRDLVVYRRSALGYVSPYNVGQARVLGLEIAAGADILSFLLADVAVTLLDPRDVTPGRAIVNDILPFRSRLVASPRLQAHASFERMAPFSSASLEVRYTYQASRYADSAGLAVIPEQGSLDAEARIAAYHDRLTLRGRATNLLDAQRFDLVGYPLAGRAVFVAMEAAW